MKHRLFVVTALLLGACCGAASGAESFPARPVRYIVPFPPGGISDMMARVVAQQATSAFKQSVVIENRPGGNAMIGAAVAAKARSGFRMDMGCSRFGAADTAARSPTLHPRQG